MKKIILITLIFCCVANMYGQHQTYKGKYILDDYTSGNVEYEYLEVNNDRVLDGYFTFTAYGSMGGFTMSGYFKNGLKDGSWNYANSQGMVYERKNFKNGKLDGLCESGDLKLNLKDNHFVGSFTYTKNRTTYTGQFNQNGYADGEWVIDSNKSGIRYIRTLKWENGTLVSDIEFDESTGKKIDYLSPKRFGTPEAYLAYQENISNYFERKVKSHPIYEYYENKSKHSNLPKRGIYMGEYPMTIPPFNGKLKLKPNEKQLETSMNEGIELYNNKKYEEAIEIFQQVIDNNPSNIAYSYEWIGSAYRQINNYSKAVEALYKAVEFGSNDATTYFRLGHSYFMVKKYPEAIVCFQKAINGKSDNLIASYKWLGFSYRNNGNCSKAIEALNKAIELGTDELANVYHWLGSSYACSKNKEEAIKAYQKAADLGNEQAKKALIELNNGN